MIDFSSRTLTQSIAARDWAEKVRQPTVRGPKFEVFGTSNPELRTFNLARPAFPARRASRAPHPAAFVYHNHLQGNNLDRRNTFP
jgi:hypothetical protein